MSTSLEGNAHLGQIYDVKNGKFADSNSIESDSGHQLFDFSTTNKTQSLGGVDYDYSDDFIYQNMVGASYQTTASYSMEELYTSTSVSLNISGSYGAFSGELNADYSSAYLTNTAFYAYNERRMYQLYSLQINASLSDRTTLISKLKASVQTALNGATSDDLADEFVATYGTHFLYRGIYGGSWQYSETLSEYYYQSESDMSAKFTANYGNYESSISASSSKDTIQDYSQSDGIFNAKGGDADYLSDGFDAWANSIEDQNKHVLTDFDNSSLQPVSILVAEDSDQEYYLDRAIKRYLAGTIDLEGFEWDEEDVDKEVADSDGNEAELRLDEGDSPSTNKVIIGMALSSSNSEMKRMALKLADLDTNETSWITTDGNTYNSSNYERVVELPSGYIATGLGARVGNGNVKNLTLYYQAVDPANTDNNNYLSNTVQSATDGSGDNHYHEFAPGNGNNRILIGASFHVKDKNLKGLTVYTSPLQTKTITVSTVTDDIEATTTADA
ncbi:MAG: MAC/perforin domain-containing protein [Bacteroidota bacterium]